MTTSSNPIGPSPTQRDKERLEATIAEVKDSIAAINEAELVTGNTPVLIREAQFLARCLPFLLDQHAKAQAEIKAKDAEIERLTKERDAEFTVRQSVVRSLAMRDDAIAAKDAALERAAGALRKASDAFLKIEGIGGPQYFDTRTRIAQEARAEITPLLP